MKKLTIICIALGTVLASCTKDIHSLNIDPKHYSSVPAGTLFLQGEKNLSDACTSTSVASAPFRVLSQEWTEITYVTEAQYKFSQYNAPNGWWNNLYGAILNNLGQAKLAFYHDAPDAATLKNDLIITDLLEIYAYNLIVATYGPIPYSQAENNTIPFPKYDAEKDVYTDLLKRLDTCIAGLNTSAGAMGNADQIYGGNVAEWKKFGTTLKLKIGLLLADVDATTASNAITQALATGILQSDADDALFSYDPASPSNSNPLWGALINSGRHDFMPANLLVSTMVGWNDPRLPLYFTKTTGGNYAGGTAGAANQYNNDLYSDFSAQMQAPAYQGDLMDYAESQFYLAEAAARGINVGGTPDQFYNAAITASIQFWGGTATDAATYLLQPSVLYATAAGDWHQKIAYQEWIAFYNRNWDAWTVIRRLGYPQIDVVSPPIGANGKLPLRYTFPTTEANANSINYASGVKLLPGGQDAVSTKLYWMK